MASITAISGFPEWLPEERIVEQELISRIESVYRSFGFVSIETPAVEHITTLASKGDIKKEIYGIRRVNDASDKEGDLALHFDLTVPLARYVAQHYGKLIFPFKRYQCQKVWRGERPQEGRFREFYQFDCDIIAQDELPLAADAEVVSVVCQIFAALGWGAFTVKLNNRKLLLGYYEELGVLGESRDSAIVAVDKLAKIGPDGVMKELIANAKLSDSVAANILAFSQQVFRAEQLEEFNAKFANIKNQSFHEGLNEVTKLIQFLPNSAKESILIDLSIARGLDYYTGTIVETYFDSYSSFGSVCSGGRYDDLASRFCNKKLPGVGVSIGVTRLLHMAFSSGLLKAGRSSHAKVFILVPIETERQLANQVATALRAAGINTEVSLRTSKVGKQIEYADKRQIPFILFPGTLELKQLSTGTQTAFPTLTALTTGLRDIK